MLASAAAAQIRLGEHDGAHFASVTPTGVTTVNGVAFGDLDGDGDLDAVCAVNHGSAYVCWNEHGGSLRRTTPVAGSGSAGCVAVVDVDRDGDLDVFLGGGGSVYPLPGPCRLYRNDGQGILTSAATLPTTAVDAVRVHFADFDGDGDPDAVVLSEGWTTAAQFWTNDGSGGFTDVTASRLPTPTPAIVLPADVDGDGDHDLVASSGQGNGWLANDGSGTFVLVGAWGAGGGFGGQPLAVTDFDGDGAADVLTHLGVHLGNGTGGFTRVGTFALPSGAVGAPSPVVVDCDRDGRLDVVGVTDRVVPYLLRDTGGFVFADATAAWFEPHALVPRTIDFTFPFVGIADLDGDGTVDLVTGGVEGRASSSTTVGIPPTVFLGSGGQRFVDAARPTHPFQQYPVSEVDGIDVGDVDGDGDLDLWLDGALHRQAADGALVPTGVPLGGAGATRLHDVDSDGDLDALVLPYIWSAGPPRLLHNDGHGNFTPAPASALPATTLLGGSLALGDIDGDGDDDVVVGSREPSLGGPARLQAWHGDGAGTFTVAPGALPATPVAASRLVLADLDGDGDLDLVALLGHHFVGPSPDLLLCTNDSTGSFTDVSATHLPPVGQAAGNHLAVLDVDGDGDLDLSCEGVVLHNDGSGSFSASTVPSRLALVDLDGDGALEDVREDNYGVQAGGRHHAFGWNVRRTATPCDLDDDGDLDLVVRCLSGAPYQWSYARTGVLFNLQRDLRVVGLPRLGRPFAVSVRAAGGGPTVVFVAAAFERLTTPLVVPGLGHWRLDPSWTVPFGFLSVADADTAADLAVTLPHDPAFAGLELTLQALFAPSSAPATIGLSAAATHVLRP
jgi:hypothetical protein